jgi:predicted XRE-type DNA-binding protein
MKANREILKRIEKASREKSSLTRINDWRELAIEDKFKIGLCRHFVQFVNAKKMKLKELSALTEIPITRLSEITNYKIKKFTVDQLLKNLTLLASHDSAVRANLSFLEEAVSLPLLKTAETNKLTKRIREARGPKHASYL